MAMTSATTTTARALQAAGEWRVRVGWCTRWRVGSLRANWEQHEHGEGVHNK